MIVTAILTPILTAFVYRRRQAKLLGTSQAPAVAVPAGADFGGDGLGEQEPGYPDQPSR